MADTACMLCKRKLTFLGLRKHFFSTSHKQDIINAVHTKRKRHEAWLQSYETSRAYPKLYVSEKETDACYFCPECKFVRGVKNARIPTCGHFKEMADFIKECLASKPSITIVEEVEKPKASLDDMEALKKQNTRLQTQLTKSRESESDMLDEVDGYFSLLEHLHSHDTVAFDTSLAFLKTSNQKLYDKVIRDLDIEV
jgi:hypothetical protein